MFWQKIKKPIIGLAPMDGVTDKPARQIQCNVAKPDVLFTEFISAEGFIRNPAVFKKTLAFDVAQRPIVAQVFGYSSEAIYEAVKIISKMGFDGIDINMGCPARKILFRGGGGALIGNYKQADKILKKAAEAIKESKTNLPLSVKTRIGQKTSIAKEWCQFLSDYPLSAIIMHGRLLSQGLSGEVCWNEIKNAAKIAKDKNIVFVGNGGIKTLEEAIKKTEENRIDGVLIGQAAMGNPWVFKKNYKPSKEELFETIKIHAESAENFYGKKGFNKVLRHFSWYPRGFKNCKQLKIMLLKSKSASEVGKILAEFSAISD